MAAITLAFLLFVSCLLALKPDTRIALYLMPFWFVVLLVAYHRRAVAIGKTDRVHSPGSRRL